MSSFDSCTKFEGELAAYLEGENRPELLAHVQQCDFCRCVLADVQQIRDLSCEVDLEAPPPSVWTHIRATLIAEGVIRAGADFQPRGGLGRWLGFFRAPIPVGAIAAAVVAAVVLFKAPGYLVRPHILQPHAVRAATADEYMAPADVAQLRRTIQQLELAYRANESLLDPSMKATYEKSLDSLNDEIRECQVSMKQEPEDGLAREYLSNAYAQKAELLQSALEFDLR